MRVRRHHRKKPRLPCARREKVSVGHVCIAMGAAELAPPSPLLNGDQRPSSWELAGVAQAAATGQAKPVSGSGLALEWIAAAVIGGVRLGGGAGGVFGALLGALVVSVLHNACQQAGWPVPLQEIILGVFLLAAVALDRLRHGPRNAV